MNKEIEKQIGEMFDCEFAKNLKGTLTPQNIAKISQTKGATVLLLSMCSASKMVGNIEVKELTKEEISNDSDLKQKMEYQAFFEKIENIVRKLLIERADRIEINDEN
jgi:hypothetical protein